MIEPEAAVIARLSPPGVARLGLSTMLTRPSRAATAAIASRVPSVLIPSATTTSSRPA